MDEGHQAGEDVGDHLNPADRDRLWPERQRRKEKGPPLSERPSRNICPR
jgi:hypothetical protein